MFVSRPQSVYAPDTPLADLRTAELFVVSSLRLWTLPYRDPAGIHPDWRWGFVRAGIDEDGTTGFDTLFRVVAAMALRSLDVRCQRCACLGEDEAWLLQLTSLFQQRRGGDANAILADWLPPAAVRIVTAPAQGFATALAARGLHIPYRHAEAATVHRLVPSVYAAPGLVLVQ